MTAYWWLNMLAQNRKDLLRNNPVSKELIDWSKEWMRHPRFELPNDCFYEDHNAVLLTLCREGPFQCEIFIAKPNVNIPLHKHPNVESFDYFLNGSGTLTVGDALTNLFSFETHRSTNLHKARHKIAWLSRDTWHGGTTHPEFSTVFLTFQRYFNIEPTHVAYDWIDDKGNTSPTDGRITPEQSFDSWLSYMRTTL